MKLIKTIKDTNGRCDEFSISLKLKQILWHWGYELVELDSLECKYKIKKKKIPGSRDIDLELGSSSDSK